MNNLKNKIGIGTLQFGFDYGIANKTGKLKTKEIIDIKKFSSSIKDGSSKNILLKAD